MSDRTYYITTPIYYPSNKLHIGHAYSTVAADALARYHRLKGDQTRFLTGTDEHGQKIERAAKAVGKEPIQFVDEIVAWIKNLWKQLHISYDDFIRTTEPRHIKSVQLIFKRLYEKGDIYKSEYEGWYCAQCETFFTETQLKEGNKCPDHEIPVERLREESYFFRLSKYADQLLSYIEANPDFIQPVSRRNEVISFIKQGLEDLCVSRTSFTWGIPVPFDPKHVIYVWIDALANYATALGYPDGELYKKFWPQAHHLIGKDILRFHAIIWPIVLLALGEPLPKKVFGHGWVLLEGGKMSKARGNVVDPLVLIEKYGVDVVRYYLLREVAFGQDGVYSEANLILRTNVDLANDLGNLLSRTTAMIERFGGGSIPAPVPGANDSQLPTLAAQVIPEVEAALDRMELSNALIAIWKLIGRANKYIDEEAPWNLAKAAGADGAAGTRARARLDTVLYDLAEMLRLCGTLLAPFLVEAPGKIWAQLGLTEDPRSVGWDGGKQWGFLKPGIAVRRGDPIFPRLEADGEPGEAAAPSTAEGASTADGAAVGGAVRGGNELLSIDDFAKIQLRVAEIVSAERVPGADKLLRLQVRMGEENRQIVSGIAQHYSPEDLPGKKIILVANLKPAKIRGVESFGMLLAASEGGTLTLVVPERDIPSGAKVK